MKASTASLLQEADEIIRLSRSSRNNSSINSDIGVEKIVPARGNDEVPEVHDISSRKSNSVIGILDFEDLTRDNGVTKNKSLLW